jgi:hypothetical protein
VSANPNLQATEYKSPDNPVTVATIAALMAQGWGPPEFSKTNPLFSAPAGGTLVASILLSDNNGNAELVSENAQQPMRTVTYFNLPNDVTIEVAGSPAILYPQGSVMVLEQDNGPSAYTAPLGPPPLPADTPALAGPPAVYTFPVPVKNAAGQWTSKQVPNTAVFPCEAGQDTMPTPSATNPTPTATLFAGVPNNGPWTYDGRYGAILDVILVTGMVGGKGYYVSAQPVTPA